MTEDPSTAEQFATVFSDMFDELDPTDSDETETDTDHAADLMAAIEADNRKAHP